MDAHTKPILFPYDSAKAKNAVLWLLHKHGGSINKLKLVKLIFFADRQHLFHYGRPIAGGRYVAMKHGPVSSELLNELNKATPSSKMPFKIDRLRVLARDAADEDKLSQSDIEILNEVDSEYGKLDPFRLAHVAHQLEAYKKNYPDPNRNTSLPLPYEDFFLDLDDPGILEIIQEHQEAVDLSHL